MQRRNNPTMKLTYRPRGTSDFTPDETEKHRHVENRMRTTTEQWGYEETKTSTFEHTELFTIKSGEAILENSTLSKTKVGESLCPFTTIASGYLKSPVDRQE